MNFKLQPVTGHKGIKVSVMIQYCNFPREDINQFLKGYKSIGSVSILYFLYKAWQQQNSLFYDVIVIAWAISF